MTKIDGGLRSLFRANLPQFHWQSVETGLTGLGVPDSNFCAAGGIEGWVEYKQTDGWAVTLRPEQVGWLTRRARLGGRVWVAVRRCHTGGPRLGPPVDQLWLVPGRLAVAAATGGLRHPAVAGDALQWAGGPARWPWPVVGAALKAAPATLRTSPSQPPATKAPRR